MVYILMLSATKLGLVGRYLTVLDLKTSCRALSASVWWTKKNLSWLALACEQAHVGRVSWAKGSPVLGSLSPTQTSEPARRLGSRVPQPMRVK